MEQCAVQSRFTVRNCATLVAVACHLFSDLVTREQVGLEHAGRYQLASLLGESLVVGRRPGKLETTPFVQMAANAFVFDQSLAKLDRGLTLSKYPHRPGAAMNLAQRAEAPS